MSRKFLANFMAVVMVFTLLAPMTFATPSEELNVEVDLKSGELKAALLTGGQADGLYSYSISEKGGNQIASAEHVFEGKTLHENISDVLSEMDLKKSYEIRVEYQAGKDGDMISKTIDFQFPDRVKIEGIFKAEESIITGELTNRESAYGGWYITAKKKGEQEETLLHTSDKISWGDDKGFKAEIHDALRELEAGEYTLTLMFTENVAGLKRDSNKLTFDYVAEEKSISQPKVEVETLPLYDANEELEGYDARATIKGKDSTAEVHGKWNLQFEDEHGETLYRKEIDSKDGMNSISLKAYMEDANLAINVIVDFKGRVDGVPVELSKIQEITIPDNTMSVDIESSHSFEYISSPDGEEERLLAVVDANLKNLPEGKVEGKWEFSVVDYDVSRGMQGSDQQSVEFDELGMGMTYNVLISFKGTVNGEKINAETIHILAIPKFEAGYDCKDEKVTLNGEVYIDTTAEFLNEDWSPEMAEGDWYFSLWKDDENIASGEKLGVSEWGSSYTFASMGEADTAAVVLEGTVDEQEVIMWSVFPVNKECKKIPGSGKTVIDNAEDGKKVAEDIKGGTLPKTATEEPKGMLYGLMAAVAGLVLLGFAFRKKLVLLFR
ncbi:hypothetical protein [Mechercharimyces sp. CAU 1602]|uniref:hypothetical protein n=1 Tax=Mechercharimyces sp. CAU 1602 TaxID=2973933 RepID=UPI002161CD1D|nr:hypothetical protein [Mechercharimyces sp. CAU 1602]MCS1352772.1 hypothetical protein [Mechercharimyces sp. CAU 1602]